MSERVVYACPQCGATDANDGTPTLERSEDATGVVWQCHNPECYWAGDDHEMPVPVSPPGQRMLSYSELMAACEVDDETARCGKALEANDRSCALEGGHDGDCAPASDVCAGCGRVGWHKFGCSIGGRQQMQLSIIEQGGPYA